MQQETASAGPPGFSVLFARALAEWPDVLDVRELVSYTTQPDSYSVEGLGELADELAEKYFGKPDEILMANLHQTIFSTIHAMARFCTEAKPSALRADTIKKEFMERLQDAITIPDLGWRDEDKLLANRVLLDKQ